MSINQIVVSPIFSPEQCDEIVSGIDSGAWRDAQVEGPAFPSVHSRHVVRLCDDYPVEDRGLVGGISKQVEGANKVLFGLELSGILESDPVVFVRYRVGHHFEWHDDIGRIAGLPPSTRKLSFTVQLSPPASYEGSHLEFAKYTLGPHESGEATKLRDTLRQQGFLIVFPAFMTHRVTQLTSGVRHAIVGWMHGPEFR